MEAVSHVRGVKRALEDRHLNDEVQVLMTIVYLLFPVPSRFQLSDAAVCFGQKKVHKVHMINDSRPRGLQLGFDRDVRVCECPPERNVSCRV